MKQMLKTTQKFAIPVIIVIIIAALAALADQHTIDQWFGAVVSVMATVLFWKPPVPILEQMPLVVVVLFGGAIFFTLRFKFINLRAFKHSIDVTRGKYDNPDDPGEVSHFEALSSALSATVGLGNIAGVAIAVSIGGPGAIFWMMMTALFGMASKFAECTLGQMYRRVDKQGNVSGGPMVYLRDGLAEMGPSFKPLGVALSVIFAILCIGASFGGGNMFQANQSFQAVSEIVPWLGGDHAEGEVVLQADEPKEFELSTQAVRFRVPTQTESEEGFETLYIPTGRAFTIDEEDWTRQDDAYTTTVSVASMRPDERYNVKAGTVDVMEIGVIDGRNISDWAAASDMTVTNPEPITGGSNPKGLIYGLILAGLVGLVIIGGIQSIAKVASKIVPAMCAVYVLAALTVVFMNYEQVPGAIGLILSEAFAPSAIWAGGLIGVFVQGVQRAAFSSEAGIGSAAIAHSAARTDEPVREGIVALLEPFIDTIIVCFMTGIVIVITGVYTDDTTVGMEGISLTSRAFGSELSWFPIILSAAVVLFAYSTMISWSYYGERCWTRLFGASQSMPYRMIFLLFIVLGSISSLGNVLDFSDLMLLSMAFPNVLGAVLLSGKVAERLDRYWKSYLDGEFEEYE
ncbi:MAG: alanine/glycine:cation symporter family protein [Persicimonas sp.]